MSTISPSCAKVLLRLKELSPVTSQLTEASYNDLKGLTESGLRVRIEDISEFVNSLRTDSGNPDIGLACYDLFHPGQLQSQLYPMTSSANLGEALLLLSRFSSLLSDGVPLLILEESDSFSIVFLRLELLNLCRYYIDCYISTIIAIIHWLIPQYRIMPISVSFSYDKPDDISKLEALLGNNLQFSCLVNKITISSADWSQILPTAAPELQVYYNSLINLEVKNFPIKISSVVKNHIVAGLAKGFVIPLESIASSLNLSPRMLQNRLEEEQTGVRQLLDECRMQLAIHLLGSTSQSSVKIAQSLGFREISSFYRACSRWFGCSPGAYRLKLMGGYRFNH